MTALSIFAKPPRPGLVKTRLISDLGADGATRVYRHLLTHALRIARESELDHSVFLSEASDDELFQSRICRLQQGADLGARMLDAFQQMLTQDNGGAIIVGSDCLDLTVEHIRLAAQALIEHDLVLVPAIDGGYVLIGCRRVEAVLFDQVRWSSAQVLSQTVANAKRLGYSVHLLETVRDVDTLEDMEHYPELLELISPG